MCCSLQKIQKAKIFNFLKGTDWNAPEVVEVLIPEPQRHRRHLYMFRVVCRVSFPLCWRRAIQVVGRLWRLKLEVFLDGRR
jgi:hypothetical protein